MDGDATLYLNEQATVSFSFILTGVDISEFDDHIFRQMFILQYIADIDAALGDSGNAAVVTDIRDARFAESSRTGAWVRSGGPGFMDWDSPSGVMVDTLVSFTGDSGGECVGSLCRLWQHLAD
jgi:hypothetical protein